MTIESNLFLIDGDNLLNRCYFATHKSGENAPLAAFIGALMREIRAHRGGLAILIWDGGRAPWRKELLPEYKRKQPTAERQQRAADVKILKAKAEALVKAMGVLQLRYPNVEADDVIAYLSRCCKRSRIYSTDKDFFTLVTKLDRVILPEKGESVVVYAKNYESVTGFKTPWHYRLFKAISGDNSDKIPGVKGVGEKTVMDVLAELDTTKLNPARNERGMGALLDLCKASSNWRWKKIYEKRDVLDRMLRLTDLLSPRLLSMDILIDLTGHLEFTDARADMERVAELANRWGFTESQTPREEDLRKRVCRLQTNSFSFAFAQDPEPDQWGM